MCVIKSLSLTREGVDIVRVCVCVCVCVRARVCVSVCESVCVSVSHAPADYMAEIKLLFSRRGGWFCKRGVCVHL